MLYDILHDDNSVSECGRMVRLGTCLDYKVHILGYGSVGLRSIHCVMNVCTYVQCFRQHL